MLLPGWGHLLGYWAEEKVHVGHSLGGGLGLQHSEGKHVGSLPAGSCLPALGTGPRGGTWISEVWVQSLVAWLRVLALLLISLRFLGVLSLLCALISSFIK